MGGDVVVELSGQDWVVLLGWVLQIDIRNLGQQTGARGARVPARAIKDDLELVCETRGDPEHVPDVLEVTELDCDRVKGVDRVCKSVGDWLFFLLGGNNIGVYALIRIGSKHTIPNDEGTGVVLVDAVRVATVVHAMGTRGVDDVFEPTHSWDDFYVHE